jgi:hypothetical protein
MWRGPLPHVSVTVVVTSARPGCAPTTPRCRPGAHGTSSLPRMRPAWLQRTPAPRRAPPTRSTSSHTVPSRRCARFPQITQPDPANQIAAEHGRRRARPVVHGHPRQPPYRGVDSRCVSAARIVYRQGSIAMSRNAPAVEPDAFRADHDAALDHQLGSPSDCCAAPAAHARYQHRDRVPLDRPCPAARPDRNQRHHPGPNCPPARTRVRRNDQQDTHHEPTERARRRETPQRAENEFDPAPSDADAAPASSAASRPRSSPHADSHNNGSPT